MATDALTAGSIIDGFRIEEEVHRGGMASLWRVARADIAFPLIMKVPQLSYGDDPAAIVGFEVEQMILPTLSGIHVPRFVAAGDFTAQPYIVMEFIAGASLRTRLDDVPLPPAEVAALGAKVAAALHDIHRQHVIHLDLKPSSVLFRKNGEAVLIDYGLAHHSRFPDLLAEELRLPMGTGPYISPEQVLGVRDESRSDLFALGVMLYHLTTGERPFGNPTTIAGLRRRLYRDPIPPRALRLDCPPWLQEVILRCLEVEAIARYRTAGQVAFDLQHPEQVSLTARAGRTAPDRLATVAKRWIRSIGAERAPKQSVADHLATAPIVMVAVDVSPGMEVLSEELRRAVRRILQTEAGARLACVNVLKISRVGIDITVDEQGRNLHVQRLVELKHRARPLGASAGKITFHVLEAPDAASALTEFALSNHVDHIVIGARASSALRRFLGSVSSQVVAEATCTVTVVRAEGSRTHPQHTSAGDTSH
jgi:eukaryotic-like serine/threonine-protein kinase